MFSIVAAPPVVKPKPMLGSLPPEILVKIVGFAIGDLVTIHMSFSSGSQRATGIMTWSSQWAPSILLVSKNIRRAAQSVLPKVGAELEIRRPLYCTWMALRWFPSLPLATRHFEKLVGKEPDRVYELE
ncbi:uncharacterized protein AB675_7604 [Cyphellophora attinorum]|uniref:Uncharacterized protein n=1 Tax=Cyphellophora attinorum TaxID=1664694 RepID=A0A0N1H9X8_9EURO|nr:uncharacterized protein AB675_7604 [Phialophora attinorum]KPI40466.1 hypothetical protein AB675_7604 [Phialophora attinorum]